MSACTCTLQLCGGIPLGQCGHCLAEQLHHINCTGRVCYLHNFVSCDMAACVLRACMLDPFFGQQLGEVLLLASAGGCGRSNHQFTNSAYRPVHALFHVYKPLRLCYQTARNRAIDDIDNLSLFGCTEHWLYV